jgi:hypothetical protein
VALKVLSPAPSGMTNERDYAPLETNSDRTSLSSEL